MPFPLRVLRVVTDEPLLQAFALNSKGHHILLNRFLAPVELPPNVAAALTGDAHASAGGAGEEKSQSHAGGHHRRGTSLFSQASIYRVRGATITVAG